jgi:hypothetical protein
VTRGRSPAPDKPCLRGLRDENQRLAAVSDQAFRRSGMPCIPPERDAVQSAGADCGDLRWATAGLDFSEERSVVASEGDLVASRGGRVSTWVDDRELRSGHESSGRRDRSPSLQANLEDGARAGARVHCRSTRRPELPESTLGVMRRHADQGCFVGARRRSPRRRSHRRDWQPARGRASPPRRENRPIHRRRTNR